VDVEAKTWHRPLPERVFPIAGEVGWIGVVRILPSRKT
jgi:hypothetical protein